MDRGSTPVAADTPILNWGYEVSFGSHTLSANYIWNAMASGEYPAVKFRRVTTDANPVDLLPDDWMLGLLYSPYGKVTDHLFRTPFGEWVSIRREPGVWNVAVAGKSSHQVDAVIKFLRSIAPPVEIKADDTVNIYFWTLGEHGPANRRRELEVPHWSAINENYPAEVQEAVYECIRLDPDDISGRLTLWHGKPGVGKSYAIRALAREWLPWCDTHYVVDPEAFFGSANYMLHVLLDSDASGTFDAKKAPQGTKVLNGEERWKLVIVEDADEFLQADAKVRQGQSLSRLLNLADGLVGQGTRLLLLLTTNERLQDIHPAVSRPGRCLANVHFRPFEAEEATLWLKKNEIIDQRVKHELTLAEMFDIRREQRQIKLSTPEVKAGVYI